MLLNRKAKIIYIYGRLRHLRIVCVWIVNNFIVFCEFGGEVIMRGIREEKGGGGNAGGGEAMVVSTREISFRGRHVGEVFWPPWEHRGTLRFEACLTSKLLDALTKRHNVSSIMCRHVEAVLCACALTNFLSSTLRTYPLYRTQHCSTYSRRQPPR